jgi:hypothetical protein
MSARRPEKMRPLEVSVNFMRGLWACDKLSAGREGRGIGRGKGG